MSAPRAARHIVDATAAGRPLVVLTWQAKLLALSHALAPRTLARILAGVNRLLPDFGGIGTEALEGRESTSWLVPSVLTRLNDRAAVCFGEIDGPEEPARERLGPRPTSLAEPGR